MMTPPPLHQSAKSKIPSWVWVLTVVGVLFIVGVYTAIFWGYSKVTDFSRQAIQKSNPEFEMLYITKDGKLKVRHRSSGKEFAIVFPVKQGRILLRGITTKRVEPNPAWLKLKDAAPYARGGWDRMGDTGMLREAIDNLFLDRDFTIEAEDDASLTACNPKLLHCVVIAYGLSDNADNRSWYSASYFEVP